MHTLFNPALFSATLLIWSEQVTVLTAAAALASMAIAHPKGRLLMWQGLLLILLLLPAIEPWAAPPPLLAPEQATAIVTFTPASIPSASFHWRAEYWLWLIAAGAALRLIWVAAGFLRLRGYRRQARPLDAPPLRFASDVAAWYASDSVPGPVTYGWWHPVILLPSRILDLPAAWSEAIQCHELIHVRRGDWAWVLAETLVRSLLWFHPAIWFAVSRIQLAREQVVDREAVSLLQNREQYLEALVAVAANHLRPDFAPAVLFLRKRHLLARVEAVVKEIDMTRSRMVTGVTAACSILPIAVGVAMWLFPFVSQAQTAPDSPGITVNAGAALLHRAPVRAPAGATASGTVILEATLASNGEVTDARVISGPQELRKEALTSVLQWHYQPGPASAQVAIQFGTERAAPAVSSPAVSNSNTAPPPPPPPPSSFPATLKSIEFVGVSPEAEQELRSRLPVHEGDTVNVSDLAAVRSALQAVDSHLSALFVPSSGGPSELTIQVRVSPTTLVQPALAEVPAGAIRQSAAIQSQKLLQAPKPAYPPIAKQARIQGTVTLQAIIAPDGTVQRLSLLTSANPLLTPAAMDAVKHWVYQPTLLNGEPVTVATTVDVTFSLQ